MRKFVWLGTFLVLAGAIGAYWMANYAAKNPSVAVTQCVNLARIGLGAVPSCDMVPKQTDKKDASDEEPACPINHDERNFDVARIGNTPGQTTDMAKPLATDPVEVIQIEQIDPKMARVIAGAIGLEENLKVFQKPQVCEDNGPDQVIVQVMDEKGVRECRAEERFPRHFMPYCDAEDCDEIPCQVSGQLLGPIVCPKHCLRMPMAEETEGLFMPYAEEQTSSEDVVEVQAEVSPETPEVKEESLPLQEPDYHHPHQGCPYPHGHYCPYPYSSRPYYRQPIRETHDDSESQTQRLNPGTSNRISNWFDSNSTRSEGQNRGERQPIDWDRHDNLATPRLNPWG